MENRNIDFSIIIPIYNESGNIEKLYKEILENLKNREYEIIFINDGSTDNSLSILRKIAKEDNRVKIINLSRNFGQSAAFQAGFDNADGKFIVTMDGDLQNDPNDIEKMYNKLIDEDYDMVVGWRKKRKDPVFSKKIPSKIANFIISKFLNLNIHDTGCSLKIFKKELLNDLHLYGEMHRFIPYLVYAKGARIGETIVNHRNRFSEKSKYGLSRITKVLLDMFTVKFLNEYSTNPIYAIGGISIFTFLLSIISFIILICMKLIYNIDMTGNPFLIISVFLFLIALQILMIGLISEIQIRIYFETSKKEIYKIKEIVNDNKK